jgi:hypothetical protein
LRTIVLGLLVAACGNGVLEGANAVPPSELPSGKVLAELVPTGCVDRSGKAVTRPATQIRVLVREDGTPLLIEQRPGYDALVVHNAFSDGRSMVFQAISTPDDADPALHEYRVDWPGVGAGSLENALLFEATFHTGGSFRATATERSLHCKLSPEGQLDKAEPVRYEEPGAGPHAGGRNDG